MAHLTDGDIRWEVEQVSIVHPPIANSRGVHARRDSLLLHLELERASKRWSVMSEASPLPNYGKDDLELARSELTALCGRDLVKTAAEVTSNGLTALEHAGRAFASPSARCAFEDCVLQLASDPTRPLLSLLTAWSGLPADVIRTSTVLDPLALGGPAAGALPKVNTVKVKCGRDTGAELEALSVLAERCRREDRVLHLRLDPNGAWDPTTTVQFVEHLKKLDSGQHIPVEWVEDPCVELGEWQGMASRGVPLAADEVLIGHAPSGRLLRELGVVAVTLKPMALGGPLGCLAWARTAVAERVRCCVSHLFDGPLALDLDAQVAWAVRSLELRAGVAGASGQAAGLSLHPGLLGWSAIAKVPPAGWVGEERLVTPREWGHAT